MLATGTVGTQQSSVGKVTKLLTCGEVLYV